MNDNSPLVSVDFGFEWTFFGDSEVTGLVVRQFGQFHSQMFQVSGRYCLIQLKKENGPQIN